MSHVLDFSKIKKEYFTVILPDEARTRLRIHTPRKRRMEELMAMGDKLNASQASTGDAMKDIYAFAAQIMSDNEEGQTVTGELLEGLLDFSDMVVFFNEYTDFVTDQIKANEKN